MGRTARLRGEITVERDGVVERTIPLELSWAPTIPPQSVALPLASTYNTQAVPDGATLAVVTFDPAPALLRLKGDVLDDGVALAGTDANHGGPLLIPLTGEDDQDPLGFATSPDGVTATVTFL